MCVSTPVARVYHLREHQQLEQLLPLQARQRLGLKVKWASANAKVALRDDTQINKTGRSGFLECVS